MLIELCGGMEEGLIELQVTMITDDVTKVVA